MTNGEKHSYWCRCGYGCDSPDALVAHHQEAHDEMLRLVNLKGEEVQQKKQQDDEAERVAAWEAFREPSREATRSWKRRNHVLP